MCLTGVSGAVRRHFQFKEARVAEVENVVKQWLQCAGDHKRNKRRQLLRPELELERRRAFCYGSDASDDDRLEGCN